MIIITSGQQFTDVDALASASAYAELLNKRGQKAAAYLPGELNQTVTKSIRSWGFSLLEKLPSEIGSVILVDASDPGQIAYVARDHFVSRVYDHNSNFGDYWTKKIEHDARIEPIGATATMIWREFKQSGQAENVSTLSANLLYTAILSNTLNFRASITTAEDERAFEELKPHTKLPDDWIKRYYKEIDQSVEDDLPKTIELDSKVQKIPHTDLTITIGQLELWNSRKVIATNELLIGKTLKGFGQEHWFLTSPSIEEGKNYFYTEDPFCKQLLVSIGAEFENGIATLPRLILRKEIVALLSEMPELTETKA